MPEKWKLETKTCACGCGKTWRALARSQNRFALQGHGPKMSKKENKQVWAKQGKFKASLKRKHRDADRQQDDDLDSESL